MDYFWEVNDCECLEENFLPAFFVTICVYVVPCQSKLHVIDFVSVYKSTPCSICTVWSIKCMYVLTAEIEIRPCLQEWSTVQLLREGFGVLRRSSARGT